MKNYLLNRYAQRVSVINAWLDAKSETGTIIMGEDGPVTRRQVILVNIIMVFTLIGMLTVDSSLLLAAICIAIAGLFVWRLNTVNKKQKHGKRGICTNQ